MRVTIAAVGFLLAAGAASGASAQGLATADLPGMQGGVGIDRHGAGFDGSMGDPAYYSGSSTPESESHYPGPYGTMRSPGALPGGPGGLRYEPPPRPPRTQAPPPAMEYQFQPYSGR